MEIKPYWLLPDCNGEQYGILFVGEGNFSYSTSFIRLVKESNGNFIVTCHEKASDKGENCHQKKLEKCEIRKRNVKEMEKSKNVEIRFDFDATDRDHLPQFPFKHGRIIFNFPHIDGKANIGKNRQLLYDFLKNCRESFSHINLISSDVGVVVTLAKGQGGTTADGNYRREVEADSWKISEIAAENGFVITNVAKGEEMIPKLVDESNHYIPSGFRGTTREFLTTGSICHLLKPVERGTNLKLFSSLSLLINENDVYEIEGSNWYLNVLYWSFKFKSEIVDYLENALTIDHVRARGNEENYGKDDFHKNFKVKKPTIKLNGNILNLEYFPSILYYRIRQYIDSFCLPITLTFNAFADFDLVKEHDEDLSKGEYNRYIKSAIKWSPTCCTIQRYLIYISLSPDYIRYRPIIEGMKLKYGLGNYSKGKHRVKMDMTEKWMEFVEKLHEKIKCASLQVIEEDLYIRFQLDYDNRTLLYLHIFNISNILCDIFSLENCVVFWYNQLEVLESLQSNKWKRNLQIKTSKPIDEEFEILDSCFNNFKLGASLLHSKLGDWTKSSDQHHQNHPGNLLINSNSFFTNVYEFDINFWWCRPDNKEEEKKFDLLQLKELLRNIGHLFIKSVRIVNMFRHPQTGDLARCYRIEYQSPILPSFLSLSKKDAHSFQVQLRNEVKEKLKYDVR
ncbi:hypothetical protein SNEBB_006837 [Seison nebaliae]|nr:hypothetical protein SNEBB_006837 [Seison nebaliae]